MYHFLRFDFFLGTKCNVCSQTFETIGKLNKHVLIHLDDKEYTCPVCNKAYASMEYLRAHLKYHLDGAKARLYIFIFVLIISFGKKSHLTSILLLKMIRCNEIKKNIFNSTFYIGTSYVEVQNFKESHTFLT